MKYSKSCEDIRIHIGYCFDQTDFKTNYLITNFIKSKPCNRYTEAQSKSDAYQLPLNKTQQFRNSLKIMELVDKDKRKAKRKVNQEEIQKLIDLEKQTQMHALNSIFNQNSTKFRNKIVCTAKQLAKVDFQTLQGSLKRSQMTKNVMNRACLNNKSLQNKNNPNETNQSSQSQSQFLRTVDPIRSSFTEEIWQKKDKKKKQNYFREKITQGCSFNELYEIERRKQTWKGFMEAERKKIKQINNNDSKMGLIGKKNRKSRSKKQGSTLNNDEVFTNYQYSQFKIYENIKNSLKNQISSFGINVK